MPCFVFVWVFDQHNKVGKSAEVHIKKIADGTTREGNTSPWGEIIFNIDDGVEYEITANPNGSKGKANVKGVQNRMEHCYIGI